MPAAIADEFSDDSAMDTTVIAVDHSNNGLPPDAFAADAASVRSKLDEAVRLLDAGDAEGARAVICAAVRELDDGRR